MASLHTEARIIQLKTIIKELQHQASGYNVASVAKRLNEQLNRAQEEYKNLSGSYLEGSTGELNEDTNKKKFLVTYQGDSIPTLDQIKKALIDANMDEGGMIYVTEIFN